MHLVVLSLLFLVTYFWFDVWLWCKVIIIILFFQFLLSYPANTMHWFRTPDSCFIFILVGHYV